MSDRALAYIAVRGAPPAVSRRGINALQYKLYSAMLVFTGVFDNLVLELVGPAFL